MRHNPGPGNRPSSTHLTDREVELLLTGSPTGSDELADLEAFVAAMSDVEPPGDIDQVATALAATARSSLPAPKRRFRRVLAVAASTALLVALSGVALAADAAAPGDLLYRVDRALERVGIGDRGLDERIEEFEVLLDRGNDDQAFEFLTEVIENSPEAEAADAEQHLEAAADSNPIAKEDNGRNEQAVETSPGQAASTENRSDSRDQSEADQSVTESNGHAIGQDDEAEPAGQDDGTEPPGQEKANENRAEPDTAAPEEDKDPVKIDNNSGNKGKETNGQPEHDDPQNDNDPPGQNRSP